MATWLKRKLAEGDVLMKKVDALFIASKAAHLPSILKHLSGAVTSLLGSHFFLLATANYAYAQVDSSRPASGTSSL